ncbi:hypothetical protein LPJ66_009964, partial [Kickxella alabastrina]
MVKKSQVADLVNAHALLADSGLEWSVTTLVAEAAQTGKDDKTVQAFLETVISKDVKQNLKEAEKKTEKKAEKKKPAKESSSSSSSSSSS